MKVVGAKCLLLLVALCCIGCGTVKGPHYLKGSYNLQRAYGQPFDYSYIDQQAPKMKGKTVNVIVEDPKATIDKSNSKTLSGMDWEAFRKEQESKWANSLYRSRVFSDVSAGSDQRPVPNPDYVLRLAVTEWNEGQAFLRGIFGFGLGHTRVQWEAVLTDAKTGKPMIAVLDARIHPGGPNLGFSTKPWNGNALVEEDLYFARLDFKRTLRKMTYTTEPSSTEWRPLWRSADGVPAAPVPTVAPAVPAAK